ncbi:hypothetical protein KTD55_28140 [Burkholderia gladioli]|uniref:hypothetical protein n=1 Tax=Burkholderia gladioli TaxID=28095 RepID=UPI001C21DD3D|nr:hypothetical protein [Burkholderia gladioli]MBU9217941.1 hypothetical protein [Burkholderia gladioli]MDN7726965.1 hypothetical protein [Burkholderia gladioli]
MLKTVGIYTFVGVVWLAVIVVALFLLIGLFIIVYDIYVRRRVIMAFIVNAISPTYDVLNDRLTSYLLIAPWGVLGVASLLVADKPETSHLAGYFVHALTFTVALSAVLLRIPPVKKFVEHMAVRIAGTLILSALFWYARARTAGDLTSVFHVDASLFTFTLYAGSVYWCLAAISDFVLHAARYMIFVGFALFLVPVGKKYRDRKYDIFNFIFFICGAFSNQLIGVSALSDSTLRTYALSHTALTYDFTQNYNCEGAKPTDRVLFLGSGSDKALAAQPLATVDGVYDFTYLFWRPQFKNLPKVVLEGVFSCNKARN